MSEEKSLELRVCVDVGYRRHSVAMGLSSGEVLEEFEIELFDFTLGTQLISTKGTTELRAERSDEALLVLFTLRHPSFSSWIFSLRVFHDRISLLSK